MVKSGCDVRAFDSLIIKANYYSQTTCAASRDEKFLVVAEKKAIYGIAKAKEVNESSEAPQPRMGGMVPIAGIKNVVDFDYDTTNNLVYFIQRSQTDPTSSGDDENMVFVAAYTNVRV